MSDFSEAERKILSHFRNGTKINYKNRKLIIKEAGKPTCPQGEPKTDIYVLAGDDAGDLEIKISYKKENADFLENKINAVRAEQLLGADWRGSVERSTAQLDEKFRERRLVYKERFQKTEKGSITLGWKFELVNKPSGDLSGKMDLSDKQVYDVYAGTNLSDDKKDASVNGRIRPNSGIADYILVTDDVSSAQDIIDQMLTIDEYIKQHPDIYFACKALNYRTFVEKYDGDRPLAVQVDWSVKNGKLTPELVFDRPLELNGREIANRLQDCLKALDIETTDDIDDDNIDMSKINR